MTLDELLEVALKSIRIRSRDLINDEKISDEHWYILTNALAYDFARMKVQVERAQQDGNYDSLINQFDFYPDLPCELPGNYWPKGLTYRYYMRMRELGYM